MITIKQVQCMTSNDCCVPLTLGLLWKSCVSMIMIDYDRVFKSGYHQSVYTVQFHFHSNVAAHRACIVKLKINANIAFGLT